ncbi:G5 domain-containing protein [Staphylococcus sp. 17KM0847]|uniref:G5 domain-containing protein n=1 Tax=Staphylococcus sp. 17KM0847 TaxID=2583989 RepID=UPI0015DC846D|nr:G5 domain-containing protein [Staphylococcus sp. 17KM0847]QLK85654.1 YSIRK-type signal peptide-containing protein [Staphylococcus sp. 17KM0847]
MKMQQSTKRKNIFSIRKFSVGVGSAMISTLIFLGATHSVEAAENSLNPTSQSTSDVLGDTTQHQTIEELDKDVSNETENTQPMIEQNDEASNLGEVENISDTNATMAETSHNVASSLSDDKEIQSANALKSTTEENVNTVHHNSTDTTSVKKQTAESLDEDKAISTRSATTNEADISATNSTEPTEETTNLRQVGGGGVDVTPGQARVQEDGRVKYDYQVSLNPVLSSDHIQTGSTFNVTLPLFAENVKFTLIGTREEETHTPHDVEMELGQMSYDEYEEWTKEYTSIPSYEKYLELKAQGITPISVVKNNIGKDEYGSIWPNTGAQTLSEVVQSYAINTLVKGAIGLKVEFDISAEQYQKTPYLPLDARLAWRSFVEMEDGVNDASSGSQSIDDMRYMPDDTNANDSSYYYIEHPEEIKVGDFNEHGLYAQKGIGITRNTGEWHTIGDDINKSDFYYADVFNLRQFTHNTYWVPEYEDLADVAVVSELVKREEAAFDTVYQAKPNPDKEIGEQETLVEGKTGSQIVTIKPNEAPQIEVVQKPVTKVISVNNQSIEEESTEFDTEYIGVDKEKGHIKINQKGQDGLKTTITTYEVDPKTGELSNPTQNVENREAVKQIIEVGTKETLMEPIPYKKRYVSVDQEVGYVRVQQEGQEGQKTTITTYEVDSETGKLSNPTQNVEIKEAIEQIIEVGTKEIDIRSIPYKTIIKYNPDLPAGTEQEIQSGINGQKEITKVYQVNEQTGVLENPKTTEKVLTEKQDRIIEIGTGETIVEKEVIPYETERKLDKSLKPGSEDVVKQQGEVGEKTTTKVPGKEAVEEITKEPVKEIIHYAPIEEPYKTREVFDKDIPAGERVIVTQGQPGLKDPVTGEVIEAPVDEVVKVGTGETIVEKEVIPYETERKLDKSLKPGSEDVVKQQGEAGEKTTTKVPGKEAVEEITKEPVKEIIHYAPIEEPYKTREVFDKDIPAGERVIVTQGQPGLKDPVTGEVIKAPVDEVVKVGTGETIVEKEVIPYETERKLDKSLKPGSEDVVKQQGEAGEKTTTKVPGKEAVEEITKEPVKEIIHYAPIEEPYKTREVIDKDIPAGERVVVTQGQPGLKDPVTGEVIEAPVDEVVKVGTGETIVEKEVIPYETERKLDKSLKPGSEDVLKQQGEVGEKTTTKVPGKEAVEEITKEPVKEIIHYAPIEEPYKTREVIDKDIPAGERVVVTQGQPGLKDPVTGEVIEAPVDEVVKVGTGETIVEKEVIPYETERKLDKSLKPGSEDVVKQQGEVGEKTTTKVPGKEAVEEITKEPVKEIIHYAPIEEPYKTREVIDKNLPAGERIIVTQGQPGLKDPVTGEVIKAPVDEVIKYGSKAVEGPTLPEEETMVIPGKGEKKNPISPKSTKESSDKISKTDIKEVEEIVTRTEDQTLINKEKSNIVIDNQSSVARQEMDDHRRKKQQAVSQTQDMLPNTGHENNNKTLLGAFTVLLGSIFLWGRRKQEKS